MPSVVEHFEVGKRLRIVIQPRRCTPGFRRLIRAAPSVKRVGVGESHEGSPGKVVRPRGFRINKNEVHNSI